MVALALWQAVAVPTTASWVGPTMAISLAIIALSFLGIAAGVAIAALRISAQARKLGDTVAGVQDDVQRTMSGVRRLIEQGQDLMVLVRHEAGGYAELSKRVRRKVTQGVDDVEERLRDLEALYDIMHEEVQDTALDIAATLRTARRKDGALGRVRRILAPGR